MQEIISRAIGDIRDPEATGLAKVIKDDGGIHIAIGQSPFSKPSH
jgi:hypothetical protein